jgi:hypothetical protein
MSDIKVIKVANTMGGAKVDSSGFFIKPKQPEPSQLSQFIQRENEREKKKEDYDYDDDKDSVDSMTVSDVSSATTKSDEEYTNESMTPAPIPAPSPPPQRVSSIVKDETLNSYLEKPKVESPSTESLNTSVPISTPAQVPPIKTNNESATINEQQNNNAQSTTAQPDNNRNDYYSDADEDVIDMTDNKLYDILASVLEDEDGENVSENMAKMNRNLEKVITMFEAYQQNNTKDEYLSKIGEAIENQNKILTQIVKALEKQGQPNQELNVSVKNENNENNLNNENNELNENNKKNKKHQKPKSSSESSSESDKGENTDDTEENPNIKKIKVSDSIKHSTSKKDIPLKHRIQIKRKT